MNRRIGLGLVIIIVGGGLYWLGTRSNANSYQPLAAQQQFNPELVATKQKCQDALVKWNQENTRTNSAGSDYGIRAHFNASLNACLADYLFNRSDGVQVSKVIDLYENRTLLELDIDPHTSMSPGEFLTDNGSVVKVENPAKEFGIRRAVLFEESPPNY